MAKHTRRYWKRIQPTSLRHALELCKDHAREELNRSVERIADEMGQADHWALYKWIQSGRIPANLIRAYEAACGANYVTQWIAASSGKMLVDMPSGRRLFDVDVVELHNGFGKALQMLTDFYAGKAKPEDAIQALTAHLSDVAWHKENVARFSEPELDFGGAASS